MRQLKNNFIICNSENVKLNDFIQKMQLIIDKHDDMIFEWIPYNEFIISNELENYTLAIWEKGLFRSSYGINLVRKSYEKVYLKFLHNSQEITDEFLNKVLKFLYILYIYIYLNRNI
jgi:hypothetical protein